MLNSQPGALPSNRLLHYGSVARRVANLQFSRKFCPAPGAMRRAQPPQPFPLRQFYPGAGGCGTRRFADKHSRSGPRVSSYYRSRRLRATRGNSANCPGASLFFLPRSGRCCVQLWRAAQLLRLSTHTNSSSSVSPLSILSTRSASRFASFHVESWESGSF